MLFVVERTGTVRDLTTDPPETVLDITERIAWEIIERVDMRAALDDSAVGGNEGAARYQNVLHLLSWIERYERTAPRTSKSLQDFLQRVTLNGDTRSSDPSV